MKDDSRHATVVRLPHATWMRLNDIKNTHAAAGRFVAVNTIITDLLEEALARYDEANRSARQNGRPRPIIIESDR